MFGLGLRRLSQKELWIEGSNAAARKDYKAAIRLLEKAVTHPRSNPIDLHFAYNAIIEVYYKLREVQAEALDSCIHYCIEDIKLFPEFKRVYLAEEKRRILDGHLSEADQAKHMQWLMDQEKTFGTRIPSFQQLAIIYEKQGRYQDSIDLCDLAISYGLSDGTKGGFVGRRARLEKRQKELAKK